MNFFYWVALVVLAWLFVYLYRDEAVEILATRNERAVICAKLSTSKKEFKECLQSK